MQPNLFSFTNAPSQDQTYQAGIDQYAQQGQSQINPGQAQIAQSSPISAAGHANLANALQQASQQSPFGQPQAPTLQAGMQAGLPAQQVDMNNAQPLQTQVQGPNFAQRVGNYLGNMFGGS